MLRHRINVGRHHIQRIGPVGGSFDSWYADNFGAFGWTLQEPSGDVALATNSAATVPDTRNIALLTYADYTAGAGWSNSGGQVALHTPTDTATLVLPGILALSRTYQVKITISGRTAGEVTISNGGAVIAANGQATRNIDADHDGDLTITPTGDFDGSIDLAVSVIQQTDILASSVFPGAELYVTANAASDPNGNEADATTNWTSVGSALLTSDSSVKQTGSFSIKIVSVGGANRGYQDLTGDYGLVVGKRYRLPLWWRHIGTGAADGAFAASFGASNGGGSIPIGASTKTDLTFTQIIVNFTHSANSAFLVFRENNAANDGGVYVDNISITEQNPMDVRNTGMAVAQTGQGNIALVYSGDGGTTRLSFDTIAEVNSIINMLNGGFVMAALSDTWAAGVDVLARFAVDADNEIVIFRDGTDLKIEYRETATSSIVTIPSGSPSGLFTIGGKWNVPGFGLRGLYNGVQVDTDKSIAAAIIGNLDKDECALFAEDSGGTASWTGDGAYPALQTETPDDSFFAEYHSRSGL